MIFLELMEASLTAPFDKLSKREIGPQYFIPEVLAQLTEKVCIVDCGAYDGDTLRDALSVLGAERIEEYFAIEPDPDNFKQLQAFCSGLPEDFRSRVTCLHAAVGAKEDYVSLSSVGTEAAFVASGSVVDGIPCVRLDSVLGNAQRSCLFLKMDIEGYEKEALLGAADTLSSAALKKVLAISAYHKYDDFYAIPSLVKNLTGAYGFFRKHMANLFDTVYYTF